MEKKRLCRSMSDKAIFGVCSGFAHYFDIDPIVVRLAVVLLFLMGSLGLWFYIIAAIIMPRDDSFTKTYYDSQTGRPVYSAGGREYVNNAYSAGMDSAYSDSTQSSTDAPFSDGAQVFEGEYTETPYTEENTSGAASAGGETSSQGPTGYAGSYSSARSNTSECTDDSRAKNGGFESQHTSSSSPRRSGRSTGIFLIAIGLAILAKIIMPRLNLWIIIAVAAIVTGIYLCVRKK